MSKSNQNDNLIETDEEYPKLLSDCPVAKDTQLFTIENTPHLIDTHSDPVYFITKSPCVVGRDKTVCDIVLPYDTVSPKHAKITEINGDYIIEDLGSKHATMVGYRSYKQHKIKTMMLKDGVVVKFCNEEFIFKNPKESNKRKERVDFDFSRELAEFLNRGKFEELDDIEVFTYKYLERFFDEMMNFKLLEKRGTCQAVPYTDALSCWASPLGNFELAYCFDEVFDFGLLHIEAVDNIKKIFELILKTLQLHINKKLYLDDSIGRILFISLSEGRSLKEYMRK